MSGRAKQFSVLTIAFVLCLGAAIRAEEGKAPAKAAPAPAKDVKAGDSKAPAPAESVPSLQQEDKEWKASQLAKIQFKGVWAGTFPEDKLVRGSVVLLAWCDYFTPESLTTASQLVTLDKMFHKDGLMVIGVFMPNDSKDKKKGKIIAEAKEAVHYSVASKVEGPGVEEIKTVPHVILFDHMGKNLYEGPLSAKMMPILKDALKNRPHPLLGAMQYKALAKASDAVRAGRLGAAHKECEEKQKDPGEAGEEAKYMLARLNRHADQMYKEAEDYTRSPTERISVLQEMKKVFAGSSQGDRAAQRLKDWTTDEALKNELKAEQEYRTMEPLLKKIPSPPSDPDKRQQWLGQYGPAVRALASRAETMRKKYPFTWGLRQVEDIVAKLTALQ